MPIRSFAMLGSRKVAPRLIIFVIFVLLVVFYFMSNSDKHLIGIGRKDDVSTAGMAINSQRSKSEVNLVVLEEHHEVLEYWFDAANKGLIPKSGNILLHIDAHSDLAPPEVVENFPTFRWPENKDELKAMMQSNDVFIQAATMSGLFKKVIWVWPSWDEDNHDKDEQSHYFGAGWTTVVVNGKEEEAFCECLMKNDGITKTQCEYLNRTALEEDDYDGTEIDTSKCQIVGQIAYQDLVDYNALHKLKSGALVEDGESLLLDIDEDFFGCVLRGQSLVDAGIAWNEVEEIDELLDELFCPDTVEHEELSNSLMQLILRDIQKKCKSKATFKACVTTPGDPASKEIISSVNKIIEPFMKKGIFCTLDKATQDKKLDLLIENFVKMDAKQLKTVSSLGFCMTTTPRSYQAAGFQLCHGANEPNSTVVTVHMPGENEVKLRLNRLRQIIQAKGYPTPGMVTLCRSVRDGYTPVPYFQDIEEHVIKSIRKSRQWVHFNVIYDRNLLGGSKGWPSRQRDYALSKRKRSKRRKNKFNINA